MGTSLDCLGSYNDGFTLSLIWRVMEEALGLGPKGKSGSKKEDKPRVPQSELPRAGKVGTAAPGGDRTRASIRAAKEEHERNAAALKARGETEAAGACCTCVCPPEQGFGQGFSLAQDIAARHPSVKQNDPCPAAVTALFPDAVGLCTPPRYPDGRRSPGAKRRLGCRRVANAVLFLTSDDAAHITGQDLLVDGGHSITGDLSRVPGISYDMPKFETEREAAGEDE